MSVSLASTLMMVALESSSTSAVSSTATGGSLTAWTLMNRVVGADWFTFGATPLPVSTTRTSNAALPKSLAAVS